MVLFRDRDYAVKKFCVKAIQVTKQNFARIEHAYNFHRIIGSYWKEPRGIKIKTIGEKKMNLQPGKRYLLKKKYHTTESHLDEITVYERAADAIKYSCAPGGFPKWVLMKYLEDNFVIYAELPPNVPDEPKEEDYG